MNPLSPSFDYPSALSYLYNRLPAFFKVGAGAYKPGLERTFSLVEALDNPHTHYPTIHIGGTNGKGSVAHLLASVLQSAGYRVGLYTSPHLMEFGERIRVNGEMISKQYVVDFVQKNSTLFETIQPSFFEATMAMAFRYFADQKVDVAVIEVGLGGRLDSTNIITPLLSIITNIGIDHTQFLGDRLVDIAREKAGIIKPNVPIVVGEWGSEEVAKVFEESAKSASATLLFADKLSSCLVAGEKSGVFLYKNRYRIVPALQATYQQANHQTLLTAIGVLQEMGWCIGDEAIKVGLESVYRLTGFQGRWQRLYHAPMVVVDTGHNLHGIRYMQQQLERETFEHLHIVLGMMEDKEVEKVLASLPRFATYYFCAVDEKRAMPSMEIGAIAQRIGLVGKDCLTVDNAIKNALQSAEKKDLVLICGSNYVVGEGIKYIERYKMTLDH